MINLSFRIASFLLIFLCSLTLLPIAQAQTKTVNVGQFIQIVANFTDNSNRGPYTYVWNFGDGNIVTGAIDKLGQVPVTYVYNQEGQFTVTFAVTNSIGLSAKGQVVIPVVADIADDPCDANVATVRSQVPWGLWDYPSSWDTGAVPGKDDWMLYAPLASALIKVPFCERYKPRFTRLPLNECVFLGSYFLGKESPSTKLAFEV